MIRIELSTNNSELFVTKKPVVSSGNVKSVVVSVNFDSAWDGYDVHAIFKNDVHPERIYEIEKTNDYYVVHKDLLVENCILSIGFRGTKDDEVITTTYVRYRIDIGTKEGNTTSPGTVQETIDVRLTQIEDGVSELQEKIEKINEDLKKKGNQTEIDEIKETLGNKSDKEEVETELSKKADKEEVSAIKEDLTKQSNQIFAFSIKNTSDKGQFVHLEDSADYPLQELHIYGNSTQDGEPTPDNPIEIVSVENPTVFNCGGNLLNDKWYQGGYNGGVPLIYSYEKELDNDYFPHSQRGETDCIYKILKCKAGVTYTAKLEGAKEKQALCVAEYSCLEDVTNTDKKVGHLITGQKNTTYTAQTNGYLLVGIGSEWADGSTNLFTFTGDEKLTCGINVNTYEPYQGTEQTLNVTLRGLKVNSGGNYVDSNGQQWICDTFVRNNDGTGRLYQYVYHVKNPIIRDVIKLTATNTYVARCLLYSSSELNLTKNYNSLASPYNKYVCNYGTSILEQTGLNDGWGGAVVSIVLESQLSTSEAQDYIDSNYPNCEILFYDYKNPTGFPIITEYTKEEMDKLFPCLKTYYGTTNIFTDTNAKLQAEYVADTKLYIDKQILELSATMVDMASMSLMDE